MFLCPTIVLHNKKALKHKIVAGLDFAGANDGSRTCDLLITNPPILKNSKKPQQATTIKFSKINIPAFFTYRQLLSFIAIFC
jgi:methylase of polypeptide subunit release factors